MEFNDISIISISNGCDDVYPENTLTNFHNKLPQEFVWRKNGLYRYHVAVDAIGLSTNFTTTKLPIKKENPSVVVGLPVKWPREFIVPEGENVIDNPVPIQSTCYGIDEMPPDCNTTDLDKFFSQIINIYPDTFNMNYFFIEYENMTFEKYIKYFNNIIEQSNNCLTSTFDEETSTLHIKSIGKFREKNNLDGKGSQGQHSSTQIFFHKSIFHNIKLTLDSKEQPFTGDHWKYRQNMFLYNWEYEINTEEYIRVFLHAEYQSIKLCLSDVKKKLYPNIIKIQCEQIKSQIFDSKNSKDIIVFHPTIPDIDTYFFHEVERKQFLPLENTILDKLNFRLTDEDDQPLKLNEGIATIVKIRLRKMDYYKKSFTVKLTSRKTSLHKTNTSSKFTVTLPQTLFCDQRWKVSVTNINLPNVFSTLPPNNFISFNFKLHSNVQEKIELILDTNYYNTKEELLDYINTYFEKERNEISIKFTEILQPGSYEKTLSIKIFKESGILRISKDLAILLGYGAEDWITRHNVSFKRYVFNDYTEDKDYHEFLMTNPININYFQPSYAMLYSDIVKPTIIGGNFTNILKIFPIFQNDKNYIIHQFKDPEHYDLLNNEIKTITLMLKNHSGEDLHFANDNIVIVDLTFSNYV